MSKENGGKKPKEKPNSRKLAFRQEAVDALKALSDDEVTFAKAMVVAKLDCKKCGLHNTTHNPKSTNCRDNPFCLGRLGWMSIDKLITKEQENKEEAKKDQKRRDLNDQPAGLINAGNFCYVNSFLQVWFNVPEFRQLIYDFRPSPDFNPPPAPRMDVERAMMILQDIFYTLQTTPFPDTDKTSLLVKVLRLNSEQQDSQEFGTKLFNALERCLPEHPNGSDTEKRMRNLFTGATADRIVCQCGQRSENETPAISIQLNIEGYTTLLDALDANFREEKLDDFTCSECNEKGNATKQADYIKLPPVLIIQLNRYKYTAKGRQKLKTPLAYPREIPAKAFQRVDQSNPPPAAMYDLFAVTIHEGSNADCGHYYDLIKSPYNSKWYRYNDETVEALAKPPGTEKPTSAKTDKSKKKDKEKWPVDQKACYGLFYRRRDAVQPLPLPTMPPEELTIDTKNQIEELFEGLTKKKIEKSEKRLYDLERRSNKLQTTFNKLETHVEKYQNPNDIAFLPTSLITDILNQEYEVAKGEKKKKKKEKTESEETKKTTTTEEEDIAAAIALSEADQREKASSSEPSTSAAADTADEIEEDEERSSNETPINQPSAADEMLEAEELMETDTTPTKEIDILAIAMEESALPTVETPELKKRTRQQNGDVKYVYTTRSPRKSASAPNTTTPSASPQKQPVSTRVAALLSSHEIPICGHGKMSIDPILFGDVKAVARAPAISMLREYDYRVKLVYDNGEKVYPPPQKDREIFIFTAADICMECVEEMRQEGQFNDQLEDDERMVRKILKEEKTRCTVKCPERRPEGHVYVAKFALNNFRKSALANRENKLAQSHPLKGTLHIDSVTTQKEDSEWPSVASLKRSRTKQRKSVSEVPEKLQKLDEEGMQEAAEQTPEEDDESSVPDVSPSDQQNPTRPVDTFDPEKAKTTESVEFNSELRCAHGSINFNQFRHSVSPDEWNRLKSYFDDCFEVKCTEQVCEECRQMEVDAQHGNENMRQMVRDMRKRINDTLKNIEARSEKKTQFDEDIKYGICSVFLDKLKKLTNRQALPPTICQECLLCQHQLPFKGFLNDDNHKESHVVGMTEEEWITFIDEIRKLEEAGADEHVVFTEPQVIHIENGQIRDMCERCYEQHIKFTEEQKYMFENENIYVKLVNPNDEEDVAKANGKSRRGRAKNMYAIKMSSSNKLLELKVQLYDKTHQLPNDQLLHRTVGGELFDVSNNQKTLFDLRIAPNNNDNPLILIAQQFSPSASTNEETGDRAPERGFVDTALAH
ncbi:hypothetical protein CAEBREN_11655 [Caenorhabditis brenneri]|uniref:ubiquitinyl hydrolase 1 n=1 Tax=Caenorhabditis brenneri TaxID=135651 RepID=G0PCU4_CAEBE|nr:hypothetical protein CAEBREN_11655 [Caenorhabditis brenneri]